MSPGCCVRYLALCVLLCIGISLLWEAEAAVYHGQGKCRHKDKVFKPGQTFQRGCDKCYCGEEGYFCITPMRPTSWPMKCKPIQMACGYRIVYRSQPERKCHAYSWVG